MKKLVVVSLVLCFGFSISSAQEKEKGKRHERIEALKVAHITSELELTPEESQKFWPVYNKYNEELRTIKKDRKEKLTSFESDEEARTFINDNYNRKMKGLEIHNRMHMELAKVVSVRKVAMLEVAEQKFKKEVLSKAKKRFNKGERGGRKDKREGDREERRNERKN